MRTRFLTILLALTVAAGCDDTTTNPTPRADFSGSWDLDLNITAKTTCSGSVDDDHQVTVNIAQSGSTALMTLSDPVWTLLGDEIFELSVGETNATGSLATGGVTYDVDFRITDGELDGSITLNGIGEDSNPCTEVASASGTRDETAPSSAFAGFWDLSVDLAKSNCEDPDDELPTLCRRLLLRNNSLVLEDDEGDFLGFGDGNEASLVRVEDTGVSWIDLTLDGDQLTGTARFDDDVEQCFEIYNVSGDRRASSCPSIGAFAGYWDFEITVTSSECESEVVGASNTACFALEVNEAQIVLNEGPQGSPWPFVGLIDGNTASLTRSSLDRSIQAELQLDGNIIRGTAVEEYGFATLCPGATVEYDVVATRRDDLCDWANGLSLESVWPDDDGTKWDYVGSIRSINQAPDTPLFPSADDVPDAPSLSELWDLIRDHPFTDNQTVYDGEFDLVVDGFESTGSGAVGKNLRNATHDPVGPPTADSSDTFLRYLMRARPDLQSRILERAPHLAVSKGDVFFAPLFLRDGIFVRDETRVAFYNDLDQEPRWEQLRGPLSVGVGWTFQPVPSLSADVFVHALAVEEGSANTPFGTFEDAITVLYMVDTGILRIVDEAGFTLGYARTINYAVVEYAAGYGAVSIYERGFVGLDRDGNDLVLGNGGDDWVFELEGFEVAPPPGR